MKIRSKGFLKKMLVASSILGLTLAWLSFGERGLINLYRMERERRNTTEKIRELAAQNQALVDEIDRLRTDQDYVESVARKELGLIKPNEVIYRFKRNDTRDGEAEAEVPRTAQTLKY